MDIQEKQARWALEKPLFEAEFIHSHLLPFFHFNENTGDYEIKTESINNTDEEDRKVAYESLNTGWAMWLRAKRTAKAQAVLKSPVMAFEEWFKKRHEKTGLYEEALCGKDDATYIKHEMNKAFQAGRKEKQAVPEGFLLMPRKCTNKMAHAAKAVDGRLSAFKYADVYDAMVEAQEQSHENG